MASAQALYKRLGFREIAPYGEKHLPEMCFFGLSLTLERRELHLHPYGAHWLGVVYASGGKLGETVSMPSMEAARAKAAEQFGAMAAPFSARNSQQRICLAASRSPT